jgi:hypothetical protein
MYLVWDGGDWGTLFQSSFSRVSDGSPGDIVLTEEEAFAYAELTKDDYATKAWELLDEFLLKSLGLSRVSDNGNSFSHFLIVVLRLTYTNCFLDFCLQLLSLSTSRMSQRTGRQPGSRGLA